MYVGPFVATWEKIVDIRSILREGAFMFGKKIAILLSTAMILTGSCVSSVAVHAQTGYAAEYAQEASAAGVQSTAKPVSYTHLIKWRRTKRYGMHMTMMS